MTDTTPEETLPRQSPPAEPGEHPAPAPTPAAPAAVPAADVLDSGDEGTGHAPPWSQAPPSSEDPSPSQAPPSGPSRRVRAAVRWTAAVLVFAALGGAATYAVTQPERTRIPGLKTPDDGRWKYPPLALPKLPAGKPRPMASANTAGVHYVDERSLLLPLPERAVPDRAFPGTTGWLPSAAYLKRFDFGLPDIANNAKLALRDDALRHIAARAWTMPDGTRTEVYLVQFLTLGYRVAYYDDTSDAAVKDALDVSGDPKVQSPSIPKHVTVTAQAEDKPYGATATRYAYLSAGDTLALVVQTRKGSVPQVPFDQTVRLQAQLLD